ncbi:MAG: class I SAM-dependent methyltransferase [Polyangiales bacterium]
MASSHGNKQKHNSTNPIQRALIDHFLKRVADLVKARQPREILDVGCGEGYVLKALRAAGVTCPMRGIDLSESAIADARINVPDAQFDVVDAAELLSRGERYDIVLMLEVLEHLPDPARVLSLVTGIAKRHAIVSVPWEPYFRGLNFLRGKHVFAFGNDPEHINHWGRRDFLSFVGEHFQVREAPQVFPWTLIAADTRTAVAAAE